MCSADIYSFSNGRVSRPSPSQIVEGSVKETHVTSIELPSPPYVQLPLGALSWSYVVKGMPVRLRFAIPVKSLCTILSPRNKNGIFQSCIPISLNYEFIIMNPGAVHLQILHTLMQDATSSFYFRYLSSYK